MNNEKKTINIRLTTVIIICVIIGIIILGLIGYIIYNNVVANKALQEILANNENRFAASQETNATENNKEEKTSEENENSDDLEKEKENRTSTKNTTTSSKSETANSTSKSSPTTPLKLGEWGLAEVYVSGGDKEVPVKVTKIIRGNEAKKLVKEYCDDSSFYKFEEPKAGYEYLTIDYTYDNSSLKQSPSFTFSLTNHEDGIAFIVDNKRYSIVSANITRDSKATSQRVAFQIPKNANDDFLVAVGERNGTRAYFQNQ